jgi:hypothetical protein
MICVAHNTVFVRRADGASEPFNETQLLASLENAAAAAGHSDWWIAEPLVVTISEHIRENFGGETVGSAQISEWLLTALRLLGQRDVADAYAIQHDRSIVDLDLIAEDAGKGFELGFFREVADKISAAAAHASVIEVRGLRRSVKWLCGARRWRNRCRSVGDEIVEFIRAQLARRQNSEKIVQIFITS